MHARSVGHHKRDTHVIHLDSAHSAQVPRVETPGILLSVEFNTHGSLDVVLADVFKHLLCREGCLVLQNQRTGTQQSVQNTLMCVCHRADTLISEQSERRERALNSLALLPGRCCSAEGTRAHLVVTKQPDARSLVELIVPAPNTSQRAQQKGCPGAAGACLTLHGTMKRSDTTLKERRVHHKETRVGSTSVYKQDQGSG